MAPRPAEASEWPALLPFATSPCRLGGLDDMLHESLSERRLTGVGPITNFPSISFKNNVQEVGRVRGSVGGGKGGYGVCVPAFVSRDSSGPSEYPSPWPRTHSTYTLRSALHVNENLRVPGAALLYGEEHVSRNLP